MGDGIIPARAGFTDADIRRAYRGGDHPRSRGVYWSTKLFPGAIVGSSPLARGLHVMRERPLPYGGIIPARAGFTTVGDRPHTKPGDHPRSRGVYSGLDVYFHNLRGSSPLARGLPINENGGIVDGGIIPARAGFTSARFTAVLGLWDHPRSRGVYLLFERKCDGGFGSSPLARGLPILTLTVLFCSGIIPARAGFTATVMGSFLSESGSSPLARGLPHRGWS